MVNKNKVLILTALAIIIVFLVAAWDGQQRQKRFEQEELPQILAERKQAALQLREALIQQQTPEIQALIGQNDSFQLDSIPYDTSIGVFVFYKQFWLNKYPVERQMHDHIELAKISFQNAKVDSQWAKIEAKIEARFDAEFVDKIQLEIKGQLISESKAEGQGFLELPDYKLIKTVPEEEFEALWQQIDEQIAANRSQAAQKQLDRDWNSYRRRLNSKGKNLLDQRGKTAFISFATGQSKTLQSGALSIDWPSSTSSYHAAALSSFVEEIEVQQYQGNSLYTGAQPYANCFGRGLSCGYRSNCSEIRVRAPYESDVIVSIKDRWDEVVDHAYISAGSSYTFRLPNGSYQPFFYYGKSWHPYKKMPSKACNNLKGGFLQNTLTGKDGLQYLSNQILTYTLRLQQNGNFSTRPSSFSEAF